MIGTLAGTGFASLGVFSFLLMGDNVDAVATTFPLYSTSTSWLNDVSNLHREGEMVMVGGERVIIFLSIIFL